MSSQTNDQKRFFIHTLGCKVNQYESEAMREILMRAGFSECISKEIADIYIINTCTVTEKADHESRYWMGFYHKMNPKAKIIVTGCYAETNRDDISFLPGVFYILKNDEKDRIAEVLGSQVAGQARRAYNFLKITDFKNHTKAFVKIQDGCDNFCSYCKVPLARGVLKSKPIDDILEEVAGLVANGFKEIVLTGVCLGAWGRDIFPATISKRMGLEPASLVDVCKALAKMADDFRVRLSSIEPRYVTDELVDFISRAKRFCRHLHIPLQSGDDEILKKMNRPYTANEYKALIDKIREKIVGVAITTDVLIGFPGESENSFKKTMNFIKEILPSRTHIFTYSKRKGTASYEMGEDIAKDVLKKRYYELNTAALGASYIYRKHFLNKGLEVLVETRRDKASGLLTGYSDNYIKVLFEGPDGLMKHIVPVKVRDLNLIQTLGEYEPEGCAQKSTHKVGAA